MNPEDMSGGAGPPGGEEQIPESWVGRRVTALVVRPHYGQYGPTGLTAWTYVGVLEDANRHGILASVSDPEDEEEPAVRRFYPWGAVLSLELEGEQQG